MVLFIIGYRIFTHSVKLSWQL